jgi:hypothetical protein
MLDIIISSYEEEQGTVPRVSCLCSWQTLHSVRLAVFSLDRHCILFAWPCVHVRPASCSPGFVAGTLSCLSDCVLQATVNPVCLILYSGQQSCVLGFIFLAQSG